MDKNKERESGYYIVKFIYENWEIVYYNQKGNYFEGLQDTRYYDNEVVIIKERIYLPDETKP